jgi:hypothetical protein
MTWDMCAARVGRGHLTLIHVQQGKLLLCFNLVQSLRHHPVATGISRSAETRTSLVLVDDFGSSLDDHYPDPIWVRIESEKP